MDKAVTAVVNEGLSIRRAALQYGVPKSSLGDRISGRVKPGAVSGPQKYLSTEEENELVRHLSRCASIGYAKSRKEVLTLVQRIIDSRGIQRNVSSGWWESFCRRHPSLTLRTAVPLSLTRAKASDPEMLSRYFDLLEKTMEENHLTGKPGQIFNMDESGMPLDPKPPKVVTVRGSAACAIGSADKSQVTVVACVSAAGFSIPPMVIWDRKTLAPELTVGELPGTIYGLSDKGWMDYELFDIWFSNHFLRYAPSARPILLLLDGHSSHYCPDTVKLAANEQILLFTLPPNTTHLSQPLDKGCFGPLKTAWKHACHQYITKNPGRVITRYQFSGLFSQAWMESMTMRNITAGFRVTGIYPVNREVFSFPGEEKEPSLAEKSGLAFIPLYSPAPKRSTHTQDEQNGLDFAEEELVKFERRYENGFDLPSDSRYNLWLATHYPDSDLCQRVWLQPVQTTSVSQFLQCPSPPAKIPTFEPKSCGRVLTSADNIALMEEKKRAREEKERAKEEAREKRKRAKEEKERAKEEARQEKKRAKEEKERAKADRKRTRHEKTATKTHQGMK